MPFLTAVATVGVCLGGLLAGYEPIGGDPDGMYRPVKSELARALREGTLPFWSDRFGLGVPLAAESHVAAFYPPNIVLYRAFRMPVAYRISMWLHYMALAAATYGYARSLTITPWGSALSAVTFSLCGFLASHAYHEPFYHILVYTPLSLLFAERFMAGGGIGWLAALALALGVQITLGHFQLQMWTMALVAFIAVWRAIFDGRPWRRSAAILGALGWGFAVAAVSLALTYELTGIAGFGRPIESLMRLAFPSAHWAQLALPGIFSGFKDSFRETYWSSLDTTSHEVCLYVGTVPLILAFGALIARRDPEMAPWRVVALLGFALATLPNWFPAAYRFLLHVPGIGQFRAPARYTLLPCFGLALYAGRGFDRLLPAPRFRLGTALAIAFAIAAAGWAYVWSSRPDVRPALGDDGRAFYFAQAALAWGVGLAVVLFWRRGRIGPIVPFAVTAIELGMLFYTGPTPWAWSIPLVEASPILHALEREPNVGLVTGRLHNIPVLAGAATGYPYLGITPPPPNYLLEPPIFPAPPDILQWPWLARFGVTHGIWEGETPYWRDTDVVTMGRDTVLNDIWTRDKTMSGPHVWRLERYPGAAPPARVARKVRVAKDWFALYPALVKSQDLDEVWFEQIDLPADDPPPRAKTARLVRWDGRTGEVEHDGTCDLVLRRTYYPGWTARLDDGPEFPVLRADGGQQAVRIPGQGKTRVAVHYRPKLLIPGALLSSLAIGGAFVAIAVGARGKPRAQKTTDA